jgi:hypothetical protein
MERAPDGDALRKIAPTQMTGLRRSAGGLRLLGALLLNFLYLVDEIVGLLEESGALLGGFDHIGFAAIKQVEVSHGVVVVGFDLDGFLELGDALIDESPRKEAGSGSVSRTCLLM